jgi:hypothetical protein
MIKFEEDGFNEDIAEIQSPSEAAVNGALQHEFRDSYRNGRGTGPGVYTRKGTVLTCKLFCPSPETVGLHVMCQVIAPTYLFFCHPTLHL